MSHARLRRHCRILLENIPASESLSVEKICEAISEQRGRRLYVHSITVTPARGLKACGVWIATEIADHIFVEEQTSKFHQAHIILHEIGHMLCGHALEDFTADIPRFAQHGHLDADRVARALARTSYNNRQEREAEMVASIILETVAIRNARPLARDDLWLWMSLGIVDD